MSYVSEILVDNPVAYWRLGESSGTNANDETGSNDGTLSAGASFAGAGALSGDADTAVTLNGGANGLVTFGNPSLTSAFSLEAWVFCTGVGSAGADDYGTVFGYTSNRRVLIDSSGLNNNRVLVQMGGNGNGGNVFAPDNSFQRNVWQHIVYTYTSGAECIYVNGILAVTVVSTSGPTWNAAFFLGGYGNPSTNYSFKGRIDEAAIYATALSPERVAAHYAAGKTIFASTAVIGTGALIGSALVQTNASSTLIGTGTLAGVTRVEANAGSTLISIGSVIAVPITVATKQARQVYSGRARISGSVIRGGVR